MKSLMSHMLIVMILSSVSYVSIAQSSDAISITGMEEEPKGEQNVAYKWGEIALLATAYDTERFNPRPTITSRFLGLIFTAVFDAWTRFDKKATPVYLTFTSQAWKDVPSMNEHCGIRKLQLAMPHCAQ